MVSSLSVVAHNLRYEDTQLDFVAFDRWNYVYFPVLWLDWQWQAYYHSPDHSVTSNTADMTPSESESETELSLLYPVVEITRRDPRRSRAVQASVRLSEFQSSDNHDGSSYHLDLSSEMLAWRTPQRVPYDAAVFRAAESGDVRKVTDLIQTRQASIYDVDPFGLGILYVSSCPSLSCRCRDFLGIG